MKELNKGIAIDIISKMRTEDSAGPKKSMEVSNAVSGLMLVSSS